LQLFVGKIDAQLFEGVVIEDFESENVENANECVGGFGGPDAIVGSSNNPRE